MGCRSHCRLRLAINTRTYIDKLICFHVSLLRVTRVVRFGMANNNKNINELVTNDDDPTVELETLVRQQSLAADGANDNAKSGHKSKPKPLSKPNNRLQLDMERFRAKWLGLTTEVRQRDQKIRALESEIREFNNEKRIAALTSAVAAAEKKSAKISEEFALLRKSYAD